MRYMWVFGWIVSGAVLPAVAQAAGQVNFEFKGAYADRYLFRGKTLNDDSTLLGAVGFGMGQWSYRFHYADPLDDQFTGLRAIDKEYAHEVAFTAIKGNKVMTYGYQFFDYSGLGLPDTQELFFRVGSSGRWNTTYGLTYDFDSYRGFYGDFSLSRFWPMTRSTQLGFNILAGGSYGLTEKKNAEQLILEHGFYADDGVNHSSALLKYLWTPRPWLELETSFTYHYALDDALYDTAELFDRGQTVWRSGLSIKLP